MLASRWAPKLLLVLAGEVPINPLGGLLPNSHPTELPGGLLPCRTPPFLHVQQAHQQRAFLTLTVSSSHACRLSADYQDVHALVLCC